MVFASMLDLSLEEYLLDLQLFEFILSFTELQMQVDFEFDLEHFESLACFEHFVYFERAGEVDFGKPKDLLPVSVVSCHFLNPTRFHNLHSNYYYYSSHKAPYNCLIFVVQIIDLVNYYSNLIF